MFDGVEAGSTVQAYNRLSCAIIALKARNGNKVISLCELADNLLPADQRLVPSDLAWLDQWAGMVNPPVNDDRFTMVAGLFLLRACERNRRHGRLGEVWPESVVGYSTATRAALLLPGASSPSPRFAHALDQFARANGLRHALDLDGVQRWYRTFMLQYGLVRAGFERIPFLLGPPIENDADIGSRIFRTLRVGPLASASFRRLIQTLKSLRRGDISRSVASVIVKANPWVLHEHIENLFNQSMTRRDIRVADDDEESLDINDFMEPPLLHWNGGKPAFVTRFKPVPPDSALLLGWTATSLQVWSGTYELGRFMRNRDGSYSPSNQGADVILDPALASMAIRVQTRSGAIVCSAMMLLFDEEDAVAWFVPSRGTDIYRSSLRPPRNGNVVIRTPMGWTVNGAQSQATGPCGGCYWHVPAGNAEISIQDPEGDCYWNSTRPRESAGLVARLGILNPSSLGYAGPLHRGDQFRPRMEGWDGTTDVVRASWPANPDGNLNPGGAMALDPELLRTGLRMHCTIARAHGKQRLTVKPMAGADLSLYGVLRQGIQWETVNPNASVNTQAIGRTQYHVAVGAPVVTAESNRSSPISLREGSLHRGRLVGRHKILPHFDGLGESIRAVQDGREIVLFQNVYHGGNVDYAAIHDGRLVLNLLQPIEDTDTDNYQIVTWGPEEGIAFLPLETGSRAKTLAAEITGAPLCAGVIFGGYLLGWAPTTNLNTLMDAVANCFAAANSATALQLAALSRWFPWPVLLDNIIIRKSLVQAMTQHGLEVLRAWIGNDGLPGGLNHSEQPSERDRRWDVTRALVGEWRPANRQDTELLIDLLFPDPGMLASSDTWTRLIRWNPAWVARVLDLLQMARTTGARRAWIGPCLIALEDSNNPDANLAHELRRWRDSNPPVPMSTIFS